MIKRYIFSTVIAAIAVALLPAKLLAADIPCSTAKLIVPWKAGGGTDIIFRVVADAVNKGGIKPQLQVLNITGQGGNKGAKEARGAKPDGCTLFAMHQSAITSFFSGRVDFTWDAFEPVAMVTNTPSIIGANKSVPYNDVKALIAAAKAKPETILAGGTLGSTSQFIFLLLEDAANVKFKHISYDGTRERMTALLAKNIELGEINVTAAQKYIKTNELKALGIATPPQGAGHQFGVWSGPRGDGAQRHACGRHQALRNRHPQGDEFSGSCRRPRGQGQHRSPAQHRRLPEASRADIRHPEDDRDQGRNI